VDVPPNETQANEAGILEPWAHPGGRAEAVMPGIDTSEAARRRSAHAATGISPIPAGRSAPDVGRFSQLTGGAAAPRPTTGRVVGRRRLQVVQDRRDGWRPATPSAMGPVDRGPPHAAID